MLAVLLRLPVYVCVATCLVEAACLLFLWLDGRIGRAQMREMVAVVYGVDAVSLSEYLDSVEEPPFVEPVDLDALNEQAFLNSLDLDLRENAILKGVDDLAFYDRNLELERARYDVLHAEFNEEIAAIRDTSASQSVDDLRRALEVMPPAQAKAQLVRFFEKNNAEIVNDAVATIRNMPNDKRKKIFAEFKTDEEQEQLADILRLIRLGVPEVPLIQRVRGRVESFDPRTTPP